ncbi:MAG: hypothetical protein R6U38_06790 [Desulfatiglandaceae bacterium]
MIESTASGLGLNEQQANAHNVVREQVHVTQETEKIRENRPVESAQDSLETKSRDQGETRRETTIDENNVIVVEKYDEQGKLVAKIPPGYIPLSETF